MVRINLKKLALKVKTVNFVKRIFWPVRSNCRKLGLS